MDGLTFWGLDPKWNGELRAIMIDSLSEICKTYIIQDIVKFSIQYLYPLQNRTLSWNFNKTKTMDYIILTVIDGTVNVPLFLVFKKWIKPHHILTQNDAYSWINYSFFSIYHFCFPMNKNRKQSTFHLLGKNNKTWNNSLTQLLVLRIILFIYISLILSLLIVTAFTEKITRLTAVPFKLSQNIIITPDNHNLYPHPKNESWLQGKRTNPKTLSEWCKCSVITKEQSLLNNSFCNGLDSLQNLPPPPPVTSYTCRYSPAGNSSRKKTFLPIKTTTVVVLNPERK